MTLAPACPFTQRRPIGKAPQILDVLRGNGLSLTELRANAQTFAVGSHRGIS